MNQAEKEQEWFDAATRYVNACASFGLNNCMLAVPQDLKERAYEEFRKQGLLVTHPFDHEDLDARASFVMITWDDKESERLVGIFEDLVFQ